MKLHFTFVIGTAAELIKMYPLILMAKERGHGILILATGQSRENFLMQFHDFNLLPSDLVFLVESQGDLKRTRSAVFWFLRAILFGGRRFKKLTSLVQPGFKKLVMAHGDTLSTLVGAWLGQSSGVPVVHIEAGLRSPKLFNPFPEECIRRLVSRLVQFHFAPDAKAEQNLHKSNVRGIVHCTPGNTLMDAVRLAVTTKPRGPIQGPFILTNLHRFENLNTSARWDIILETVFAAATTLPLIFIAHPQTLHKLAQDAALQKKLQAAGIEIRERMPFSEFIHLLHQSAYLISDGGSNQEECFYLGKPCLILRHETERSEGLSSCCVLSRFEPVTIAQFLADPTRFQRAPQSGAINPSAVILNVLETHSDQ